MPLVRLDQRVCLAFTAQQLLQAPLALPQPRVWRCGSWSRVGFGRIPRLQADLPLKIGPAGSCSKRNAPFRMQAAVPGLRFQAMGQKVRAPRYFQKEESERSGLGRVWPAGRGSQNFRLERKRRGCGWSQPASSLAPWLWARRPPSSNLR